MSYRIFSIRRVLSCCTLYVPSPDLVYPDPVPDPHLLAVVAAAGAEVSVLGTHELPVPECGRNPLTLADIRKEMTMKLDRVFGWTDSDGVAQYMGANLEEPSGSIAPK